jgi:transcription antitermination factor NusG
MTLTETQNPEQLYPENAFELEVEQRPWRIAHTKSRREKALAFFLYSKNIAYYLPLFKKRQQSKKRVRFSFVPVFTGYLFFKADNTQRYDALTSNHIANIIEIKDQKHLISELNEIHKALSIDAPLYPFDFVKQGQEVEIKRGPMKGLRGIIQRKEKNFRLVLNVSGIFQALAVNVDADYVEPIR